MNVLCVGEALWDLTAKRSFARARSLEMRPGGAAVNVALALAHEGVRVGLAAVVGEDALGEALIAQVAAAGVATALVERALPRTGLLFAERRREGARFVGYRAADEPAPRAAGDWSARVVLVTGLMPSVEHARGLREVVQTARARGARVMVDVNARPRVWRGRDPAAALGVLALADVVKASEDDLAVLGIAGPEALVGCVRAGATVITTAGAGVARAMGSFGEVTRAPRALGKKPRDTLGAGDAFAAAVVAELTRGDAEGIWDRALDRGHAWARARLRRR